MKYMHFYNTKEQLAIYWCKLPV